MKFYEQTASEFHIAEIYAIAMSLIPLFPEQT